MRRLLTFSIAAVLILSTGPPALGAEPVGIRERDAANVGREKAAAILGRTPDDGPPPRVRRAGHLGRWAAVLDRRLPRQGRDAQAFVAVDLASGETLDAAAYQAKVERAIGREPRVTPPARERIDDAKRKGASPLLAYVLSPVDYGPAVKAVKAAHPEVEWDGDRPIGDDLEVLGAVSQELIRAKAALVAKHRGPFLAEARRQGATDVVPAGPRAHGLPARARDEGRRPRRGAVRPPGPRAGRLDADDEHRPQRDRGELDRQQGLHRRRGRRRDRRVHPGRLLAARPVGDPARQLPRQLDRAVLPAFAR